MCRIEEMNLKLLERKLKVLASAKRLHILKEIKKKRSMTVTAIARSVHLSIETTSHHLQRLAILDIVRPTKRGRYVIYRLSLHQPSPAKEVLKLL